MLKKETQHAAPLLNRRQSVGIFLLVITFASDNKLRLDVGESTSLLVEGGSGGALDFVLGHAGGGDALGIDAILNKPLLDGLCTVEGEEHVGFGIDTVALHIALDEEVHLGMVAEQT